MENFGKRTILILIAGFLIMNLGWFIGLELVADQPAVRCTYTLSAGTCR
jgi:hypothetical protein